MPRGGGEDSDGLGDTHPATWESKLSRADERRIRQECFIPPFVKLRFDEKKSGTIVCSDRHEVCMYEAMFRAGFRLPFLPMIQELLNYLDLAPHQLAPNAWRYLFGCMVLWPLALGKEHQLTVREFLHLHWVHRNPGGFGVYNIQTRRGKLITLKTKYSSNRGWKSKYFFTSGQWEFAPTEKATEIRVPREVNMLSEKGGQEPHLTPNELARVNKVHKWARKQESCLNFAVFGSVPRLMELVYVHVGHLAVELRKEFLRLPFNPSPQTVNTRGATPRKDQAQAADKGKSTKVDKGKGILIEPEKPEKVVYPIKTGGVFKIREPRAPTPPAKKSPQVEKKNIGVSPKVVRALRLADEEESDAEKTVEATPEQTPLAKVPAEESDVQVIEAPLVKKRKLKRVAEPNIPAVEPATPMVETAILAIKVTNVADFLAARRSQAPPPSVPRVEDVAAFLANEPVLAVPVNIAGLVEETLQALEGPIPSVLNHPLGLNIQHILEDIDIESKGSVGMADDNLGLRIAATTQTSQ
jgi:hypothetical protein